MELIVTQQKRCTVEFLEVTSIGRPNPCPITSNMVLICAALSNTTSGYCEASNSVRKNKQQLHTEGEIDSDPSTTEVS